MEIDEIIKGLKETILICDSVYCYDRKKYIDAAIDRLHKYELMKANKNDLGVDCISRDGAIKALGYDIKSFEFKPGVSKHMDDIAKLLNTIYETQENNIRALPSVTPQKPSKGHWLMPDKNYSPKIWRKCSCCGTHLEKFTKYISFDGGVHYIENIMNYCRICGADMREVAE